MLAIRAYLQTVPPVHNQVASNRLPFPFNIRASVGLWNALYFNDEPFEAGSRSPGRMESRRLSGAGPRALRGLPYAEDNFGWRSPRPRRLQGYSLQGWFAPDITDDKALGLGQWSQTDIVAYLKGGHNRFAAASGPMAEEVADGSSQLTGERSARDCHLPENWPVPFRGHPAARIG